MWKGNNKIEEKCQAGLHNVDELEQMFIRKSCVQESGFEPRPTLLAATVALALDTAEKKQ